MIEGFERPITSSGKVYIKKPGRLRWRRGLADRPRRRRPAEPARTAEDRADDRSPRARREQRLEPRGRRASLRVRDLRRRRAAAGPARRAGPGGDGLADFLEVAAARRGHELLVARAGQRRILDEPVECPHVVHRRRARRAGASARARHARARVPSGLAAARAHGEKRARHRGRAARLRVPAGPGRGHGRRRRVAGGNRRRPRAHQLDAAFGARRGCRLLLERAREHGRRRSRGRVAVERASLVPGRHAERLADAAPTAAAGGRGKGADALAVAGGRERDGPRGRSADLPVRARHPAEPRLAAAPGIAGARRRPGRDCLDSRSRARREHPLLLARPRERRTHRDAVGRRELLRQRGQRGPAGAGARRSRGRPDRRHPNAVPLSAQRRGSRSRSAQLRVRGP